MHHILCESPFIARDFYAIRPLSLWHILGTYFLLIWGVGAIKIVFRNPNRYFSKKYRNTIDTDINHYVKSPPERVPGDKFSLLAVGNVVKFSEGLGVTNFKPFSLGKYERKFATKNPPSFSCWGVGVKMLNFITQIFWEWPCAINQRKRDDNINTICVFQGGGGGQGAEPWKLKPGFINRVLVAVNFEASKCL